MKIGLHDIWKIEKLQTQRGAGNTLKTMNTFVVVVVAVWGVMALLFLTFAFAFVFQSAPEREILSGINRYFAHYLAGAFVARFMLVGFPALSIHAYRILPVPVSMMTRLVLMKVVLNVVFMLELLIIALFGVVGIWYGFQEVLWLLVLVLLLSGVSLAAFHLKMFALKLIAGGTPATKSKPFFLYHLLLLGAVIALYRPEALTSALNAAMEFDFRILALVMLSWGFILYCSYQLVGLFLRYL